MTERNIHEELMEEVAKKFPEVEGYTFISEDPIGNLLYTKNDDKGEAGGIEFKIFLGGDLEKGQDISFQSGNPEKEVNGFTAEVLIDLLFARIVKANEVIPHWHNNLVIDGLSLASNALDKRRQDRANAGVTNKDVELPRPGDDDYHPIARRLLNNQEKFNFIVKMLIALSESYEDIHDDKVQGEFMEMTPEGPKRLINLTPAEDEAITRSVAISQKLLAVAEGSPFLQTVLGTMVHSKKLTGEQARKNTTPTATVEEQQDNSTQEQT